MYRWIAEACCLGRVASLALVYLEPATDLPLGYAKVCRREGFDLGFSAHVLNVPLRPELVPPLLRKVREFADLSTPPAGAADCGNCRALSEILPLLRLSPSH